MGMESTRMGTQRDSVRTEFAALAAWMRNEGINRLFVGDCYCCDWSNIDGSTFSCEIPQAPETIRETWKTAQKLLRSASQAILKRRYPQYEEDWDYTFLESMEFTIDHNGWNTLARVWFQAGDEILGDAGRKEIISTEGHINWVTRAGRAWETDIEASTHVETVVFWNPQD
ncbi:MAG: hypothetical protein JXR24_04460 [Acidithiobacillaceae bacterium]|nr:hypothetical protein [Acidithiobacillaceae bacterium]